MTRLRSLRPAQLRPDQAALYDGIAHGPRATGPQHFALTNADGSLRGPFNAFLLAPGLGHAIQELGAAVRYATALSPRVRELAILAVAAHWNSAFERAAHESVGRAVGLTAAELDAVRVGSIPPLADPLEAASAHLVLAMIHGDIDDDQWTEWAATLGEVAVFELSTLVGYYSMLALQMRIFRTDDEGEHE